MKTPQVPHGPTAPTITTTASPLISYTAAADLQDFVPNGIRIWEDTTGGVYGHIYIEPVGSGMIVDMGKVEPGTARTDAELWGVWDIFPEDVGRVGDIAGIAEVVAGFTQHGEWFAYPERMGPCARAYIFGDES